MLANAPKTMTPARRHMCEGILSGLATAAPVLVSWSRRDDLNYC
jgi:hypothetical protein